MKLMPEVVNMNPPLTDPQNGQASTRKTPRFRVDNVPLLIRPLYLAVMWIVGVVLYLYYALCRITSRISIEALGSRDLTQHSIFCMLENPKTVLGRSPLLSSGSSRSKSRCYQRCGRTCRM
jgi:hypothetical protein